MHYLWYLLYGVYGKIWKHVPVNNPHWSWTHPLLEGFVNIRHVEHLLFEKNASREGPSHLLDQHLLSLFKLPLSLSEAVCAWCMSWICFSFLGDLSLTATCIKQKLQPRDHKVASQQGLLANFFTLAIDVKNSKTFILGTIYVIICMYIYICHHTKS